MRQFFKYLAIIAIFGIFTSAVCGCKQTQDNATETAISSIYDRVAGINGK